jgi:DNA-binding NarL/FixJ family response regulator
MGRTASRSDVRFQALLAQLEVLHPQERCALSKTLCTLRELAQVEAIVCLSPVRSTSGWMLERFHADNLPNQTGFRTLVRSYLSRTVGPYGWFTPDAPEEDQRNVLVNLRERVTPDEYECSRGYREVLVPLKLHRHVINRALLCERDKLLVWFGVFTQAPLTPEQRRLFEAALPAVQRRFEAEHHLEAAPLVTAALEAVLGQIAAPVFVVSATGRIHETNDAGRAMLSERRDEIAAAILAALAGERPSLVLELTPLDVRGAPDHWFAVLRAPAGDSNLTSAVARVASRLKLTRRQREVLARVVTGESTAGIAATLGISERAVEQHVTAIFDRAGVDSRAALVTFVLLR